MKSTNDRAHPEYGLVQQITLQDSEIVDLWKRKSFFASNAGTWMHSTYERMLNGFHISPGAIQEELDMAREFLCSLCHELPQLPVHRPEWTIFAVQEDFALLIAPTFGIFPQMGQLALAMWPAVCGVRQASNQHVPHCS